VKELAIQDIRYGAYLQNKRYSVYSLFMRYSVYGGENFMDQITRTPKQLGMVLQRHRKATGLTQEALASRIRLRQATISALENSTYASGQSHSFRGVDGVLKLRHA
jgi:DNA-binding XRE family transcriptional regulator